VRRDIAVSKLDRWRGQIPDAELAAYAKGAFAHSVGLGSLPALLDIDTTYAFVDPAYPHCGGPTGTFQAMLVEVTETFCARDLAIYYTRRHDRAHAVRRGM
jgi:maleamate amidohydrolase